MIRCDKNYREADYYNKKFSRPYKHSVYDRVYKVILSYLNPSVDTKVVELGCGCGFLARKILSQGVGFYCGVDFSQVAIQKAKEQCKKFLGDHHYLVNCRVEEAFIYQLDSTDFVSTEVLEHLRDDVKVMSMIRKGTRVHISVPSFLSDDHVRYFKSEDDVVNRYKKVIRFDKITRVKMSGRNYIFPFSGVRI